MAPTKLKRAPDHGVANAVQQVVSNSKFKRMMLFGLRSLSELTTPPTIKYKENSIAALEGNVVPVLASVIEKETGDEDCCTLTAKVLWGIVEGLKEEKSDALNSKFIKDGGVSAAETLLGAGVHDAAAFDCLIGSITGLAEMGLHLEPSKVISGLFKSLDSKTNIKMAIKIASSLSAVTTKLPEAAKLVAEQNGHNTLLDFAIAKLKTQSKDAPTLLEPLFITVRNAASNGSTSSETIQKTMELVDTYGGSSKTVTDKGASALAAMLGPEQLKACLDALSKSPEGSTERKQALTMLSSMSYIESYADAIVKAGSVPLLCTAITQSSKSVGSSDDKTLTQGFCGACKMLGKVASNPMHRDVVVQSGAVPALTGAFALVKNNSVAAAACLSALGPLASSADLAHQLTSQGVVKQLLGVLQTTDDQDVIKASVAFLAAASSHETVAQEIAKEGGVKVMGHCLKQNLTDVGAKGSIIKTLAALAPSMQTASVLRDVGAMEGLVSIMSECAADEGIADSSSHLLAQLANRPDAAQSLKDSTLVDSMLTMMLEHKAHKGVTQNCTAVLNAIATEQDVKRVLSGLERTLGSARSDPQKALRALAGVAGLSQIPRLRQIFEHENASASILRGIEAWCNASSFKQQQALIDAGLACVETLKSASDSVNVGTSAMKLLNIAQSPPMKNLIAPQDMNDNNLNHLLKTVETLVAADTIRDIAELTSIADQIVKIMKKFHENRRVNSHCLDILYQICLSQGGAGVQTMGSTGAIKAVIGYMQRVAMYEEIQASGFRLLLQYMKADPANVEIVRRNGGGDLVKTAVRTHAKSAAVRRYLNPVSAMLTPEGDLEREIGENKRVLMSTPLESEPHFKLHHEALKALNQLTASPAGSRAAGKLNLMEVNRTELPVVCATRKRVKVSPEAALDMQVEVSAVMKNVAQTRIGAINMAKNDGIGALMMLQDAIDEAPDCERKREGLENIMEAHRRMLKFDRLECSAVSYKKGAVARMLKLADAYPNDPNVFGAAAAAVCNIRNPALKNDEAFKAFLAKLADGLMSEDKNQRMKCLEALEDALIDPDMSTLDVLMKNRILPKLFKVMDDSIDDPPAFKRAQRCVDTISKYKNLRETFAKPPEKEELPHVIKTTKRAINNFKMDPDTCAVSLKLLNQICGRDGVKLIGDSGILADIQELVVMHPDHLNLAKEAGNLLGNLGVDDQIAKLIKDIKDTCDKRPNDWRKKVEDMSNKLAFLLNAQVENPRQCFEKAPEMVNALAKAMKEEKNTVPLLAAVAKVTHKLCDKFKDDPESPYGVKALVPQMMPVLGELLAGDVDSPALKNKNLVCNALAAMTALLDNPHTRPAALQCVTNYKLVPAAEQLLGAYQSDPEVVAKILDFLAKRAKDPAGAKDLPTLFQVSKRNRNLGDSLVPVVSAMLQRHKTDPGVIVAGCELLDNLLKNGTPELQMELATPNMLKLLENISDSSPENLAAVMRTMPRFLGKADQAQINPALRRGLDRALNLMDDDLVSDEEKMKVAEAVGKMAEIMADEGQLEAIKKTGVVEALAKMFEEKPSELPLTIATTKAMKKIAQMDQDMAAKIAKLVGPIIMGEAAHTIASDPLACDSTLDMLNAIAGYEGNGRLLAKTNGFSELLENIGLLAHSMDPHEGKEILTKTEMLRNKVENDVPKILTLKEVFQKWDGRKQAGEKVILGECAVVGQHWDFVCDYTHDYSARMQKGLETELGSELMYGCKCFSLLAEHEENCEPMLKVDVAKTFIPALKIQTDEKVAQFAVQAIVDALQHKEKMQPHYANFANAPLITAHVLERMRKATFPNEEMEEMLIPRCELIEKIALDRPYFNGTDCMLALIGLWDDYDQGKYTTMLLRHVFRAMRMIVNEHWVPIVMKREVPRRLIEVVDNKNADLELLPDVLFLLGTLAAVPEIKTLIGQLKGIEACLDLLRRCLKNEKEKTNRVQANACLALANVTIGHGPNISMFHAAKGVELNITVMQRSMEKDPEYDIANGAAILMCNTCFRRDDMKEIYGKKGAPKAVMNTINKYDGRDEVVALRCLQSMFKAIGNLALYPNNVPEFLNGGIDHMLVRFYSKAEKLPDSLIEASLRTVSNLVMENTEDSMKRFGIILEPVLKLLKDGGRDTVSMLSMAFETLGNLCRLEANARNFADRGGIETALNILNNQNDERLFANGIHLLGIQTTSPSSIPILTKNGVFTFLVSLFEQQLSKEYAEDPDKPKASQGATNTELVVSGLRCVRRLCQNAPAGKEFVNAGGVQALTNLAGRTLEHPMIHLEVYRCLLNLLSLFPPPTPPPPASSRGGGGLDKEWDGDVMDEGLLPPLETAERPPSPRSWESIGLEPQQVSDLIVAMCEVLADEEYCKLLRLGRCGLGLLAYLACEKIPGTVDAFYNGEVTKAMTNFMGSFESEDKLTKTCCYIINNVAYASDQSLYQVLRKDKKLRGMLEVSCKSITKGEKESRDFCTLTSKLLNEKSLDPSRFEVHHQWTFPLELTLWDKDAYPNGVQDLPIDMREDIRAGGKLKIVLNEKEREVFHWKSSFDMILFNWRIDPKEGPFNNSCPVSRLRVIGKGFASAEFKALSERTRLSEGHCCYVSAPPTTDAPEGHNLMLLCKSKKERDRFVALLTEWRDAATYGF